ncbi:MAG: peptide-methionine (R)-S-oxide reductase MsrB [candidate division Zixibacteria bacterium]|nr:peptide-methionine (R)-S-oxide reductase MsrB [candidate division Zixibacteria bacterium]
MADKIERTDDEWREILTEEQYRILRQKGTERAFTGRYNDFKGDGVYVCSGCGQELFDSQTKYNSGSGWPSFWAPSDSGRIDEDSDMSLGMVRIEINCGRCGAHLGHRFDDGPDPTGQRYCVNSASLEFKKRDEDTTEGE